MKLTFKDLKQDSFIVEVEPSSTIRQVKEKIAEQKSLYDPERTKIIYSGKVLSDTQTVEHYGIQEKDFLVCLPGKKPAAAASASAAAPVPATPAPRPAATPAAPPPPAPAAVSSTPAVPATPTPAERTTSAAAEPQSFNDPSALAMGSAAEASVREMEAMGFARSDINAAMRAAFFNPDRAIEYLLTGIPENVQQEQRQRQQQQSAENPASAAATEPNESSIAESTLGGSTDSDEPFQNLFDAAAQAGDGGRRPTLTSPGGDATTLDFLRTNPHFQQLRQLVQQQPHMLEPILQQVAAGNPQIAQLINQNSEQFLTLLGEEMDDDEGPPGQAISVTEDEREAIERLCGLGFSRDLVIQAYFACDKNEELAANFLFDQPADDDE